LQQRTREAASEAQLNARFSVVKEILPCLDNFARARKNIKPTDDSQKLIVEYYDGVLSEIDAVLTSFEVGPVPTVGTEFDVNCHTAIMSEPSETYKEDIICKEFQKGWQIKGRIIQPAMVAVSTGPA